MVILTYVIGYANIFLNEETKQSNFTSHLLPQIKKVFYPQLKAHTLKLLFKLF